MILGDPKLINIKLETVVIIVAKMTKDARMLTGIAWNVVVEYAVLMAATIAMGY